MNSGERSISVKHTQMLNSRLQSLERAFIIDSSSSYSNHRHVIFSALRHEHELLHPQSATFALILDPSIEWYQSRLQTDTNEIKAFKHQQKLLDEILMGMSRLHYCIESATLFLHFDELFFEM